jgi:hypothetical protein
MTRVAHIVSSDSAANVGDLYVILSSVGILEGKEESPQPRETCRTTSLKWLAYYIRVLAEFGDT